VTTLYTESPAYSNTRTRDSAEVDAVVALVAAQRADLKAIIRMCRQIERDRYALDRDKRRMSRMRYAISGALSLLRAGSRS
jgi:hypothetical protein